MITHLSNIENNQDNTSVEHTRNQNYQIYFSRSPDQSTPREGKISIQKASRDEVTVASVFISQKITQTFFQPKSCVIISR